MSGDLSDSAAQGPVDTSRVIVAATPSELGSLRPPSEQRTTTDLDRKAVIKIWSPGKLSESLHRQIDLIASNSDVVRVAIMPDIHEGPLVPNGCVLATRNLIYPEAVGKDIGCGVSAIRFHGKAGQLSASQLQALLRGLSDTVPALKLPKSQVGADLPDSCTSESLSSTQLANQASRQGKYQLGTLGRGNHFVELQYDEAGALWVMVHSGSRGMGEEITHYHLQRAQSGSPGGLRFLEASAQSGQDYFADMLWATRYATESRLVIINRVADLLERIARIAVDERSYIDTPHNFARIEEHGGEQLIVHRKSANSASEDEIALIPGSMGTSSRIVVGRGNHESLCSSSHGAGRAMSRSEAFDSISAKDLRQMMNQVVFDVRQAAKLCDEAPRAYKNIADVMRAQRDLVSTHACLTPILNYKGH